MAGKTLARRMKAVFAINGDYFSYRNNGFLIRQGTQYQDLPDGFRDVLLIDEAGGFPHRQGRHGGKSPPIWRRTSSTPSTSAQA